MLYLNHKIQPIARVVAMELRFVTSYLGKSLPSNKLVGSK